MAEFKLSKSYILHLYRLKPGGHFPREYERTEAKVKFDGVHDSVTGRRVAMIAFGAKATDAQLQAHAGECPYKIGIRYDNGESPQPLHQDWKMHEYKTPGDSELCIIDESR